VNEVVRKQLALMRGSLSRPYPVTGALAILTLIAIVPIYIFLPLWVTRPFVSPEIAWDRAIPLVPFWSLVYGSLYMFLILLPAFLVREEALLRRTLFAYLSVWISSYAVFYFYPTVAPRPDSLQGEGFMFWGLESLYEADPPYNCFPSLHVAHSFVSALACEKVNRRVGILTLVSAVLVALSTLFTKQHYVLDAAAGVFLAALAYAVFIAKFPRNEVAEVDRRAAPAFAVLVMGLSLLTLGGAWVQYWATLIR
jgi:membrane-associated phospholipid phosphatase